MRWSNALYPVWRVGNVFAMQLRHRAEGDRIDGCCLDLRSASGILKEGGFRRCLTKQNVNAVACWQLAFGGEGEWDWSARDGQVAFAHSGPERILDVATSTRDSLAEPLDFPPLTAALVPGDRVVLALDRLLPQTDAVVAAVWSSLEQAGVRPADVLVLQPGTWQASVAIDPRARLPADVRHQIRWQTHDPTADDGCGYLATSAANERLYLARPLLDADFVLPITAASYDPLTGYRSPAAVLFPGLSNADAFRKAHGEGHRELQPQDDRPLRQLVEEVGWLLGIQFAIQLLPSGRRGGVSEVLAGSVDGVTRRGRRLLDRFWRVKAPGRYETVVVSIPTSGLPVTWDEFGAALNSAGNLVDHGGRIVVLSDLTASPGPGIEFLRGQGSPRSALQPLRMQSPPDLLAATQLASAADWARIYLLSNLEADVAEDLFLVPLADTDELARLLATVEDCALLTAGQHTFVEIVAG